MRAQVTLVYFLFVVLRATRWRQNRCVMVLLGIYVDPYTLHKGCNNLKFERIVQGQPPLQPCLNLV